MTQGRNPNVAMKLLKDKMGIHQFLICSFFLELDLIFFKKKGKLDGSFLFKKNNLA